MDDHKAPAAGMLGRTIRRAVLCLALAAAGIGIVWVAVGYREWRAPMVDLSARDDAATGIRTPVGGEKHLRFAVATMVSAEATFETYRRLVGRICTDSGLEERFILRPSYADVRHGLEQRKFDIIVELVAPLLLISVTRNAPRPWLVAPGLLILMGIFAKRWHIIIPAMGRRSLPLPEASYSSSGVEWALAAGIIACGILLLYLLHQWSNRLTAAPEQAEKENRTLRSLTG